MNILTPGHRYELNLVVAKHDPGIVVQFIEKEPVPGMTDGTLQLVQDGTTNEEVIAMMIDRIQYLDAKFPCQENKDAIVDLKDALYRLNLRTANRMARGVEGNALA